ncbi:MAG: hypothetical protein U9R75_01745 [Candidatus Thermoplasmatota archaeon]|nr:hypothetical protein [Candidatus Thermoplasmatota archaeon]
MARPPGDRISNQVIGGGKLGFSVSISSVIFFSSFLLLSGIIIGVGIDYQRLVDRAESERADLINDRESSELTITEWTMDGDDMTLWVKNTGDVDIHLSEIDMISNGYLKGSFSITIDGQSADILFEDEVMKIVVNRVYLNTSSIGGKLTATSSYNFNSPGSIAGGKWVHVSDGSNIVTLDGTGDMQWIKGTGLTLISDVEAAEDTVLVLGDDNVLSAPRNGTSVFSNLITSGLTGAVKLVASFHTGTNPYLIVLENDGDILRSNWDGTGLTGICTNGSNVNWSAPVDIAPGKDSFYLVEEDGSLYEISYTGYDVKITDLWKDSTEEFTALESCGMDRDQVVFLVSGTASDRISAYDVSNSTQMNITGSMGAGKTDIMIGPGIGVLDPLDGKVEFYSVGTTIRIITLNGYIFSEVI